MKKNKEDKQSFEKIERVFILDESTKFLGEGYSNAKIITSQGDLEKISSLTNDLKKVIVFCELKWKDKLYQQFYGFEVARELRMRYKLLCPIILVSVLPQNYFEEKAQREIKYNILYGRGTGFVEWVNIKNLDSINKSILPLSEAALSDLNEMLLNLRGFVIDKLTHDLKLGMSEKELINKMNSVGAYLDNRQKANIGWDDFLKRFIEKQNDTDGFRKLKEEFLIKCKQELGDETITTSISDLAIGHKVLVVEDDPDFKKDVEDKLKDHFELIVTDNSDEAIHTLNEDGSNGIVGVITDWRLYSDNSKTYWQKLQGYEILEYAAKTHFAALFSLTSEDDRNVHEIRNKLGLDIHLFKKQHLTSKGQWDLIADVVKQRCDAVKEVISSQPSGAKWTLDYYDKYDKYKNKERVLIKSLKEKYRERRNFNWDVYACTITNNSDEIWNYYKEVLGKNLDSVTIASLKEKYGLELSSDDPVLESILIVRRIYFALWFNNNKIEQIIRRKRWINKSKLQFEIVLDENPLVKNYCVLNGTSWEQFLSNFKLKKKNRKGNIEFINEELAWEEIINKSKLLAYLLCIETKQLPGGILPEERNWLLKHGIDISKGNSAIDYTGILSEDEEGIDRIPNKYDNEEPEPTDDELRKIKVKDITNTKFFVRDSDDIDKE